MQRCKLAAMAGIYFVPVPAHGVASALGTAACAHVCAKTPNLPMLEWTQVGIPFTQLWLRRVVQAAPHRLPRHKIWWPAESKGYRLGRISADKSYQTLTDTVTLRDGYLELPDKPGIGLALNDETVKERTETGLRPL